MSEKVPATVVGYDAAVAEIDRLRRAAKVSDNSWRNLHEAYRLAEVECHAQRVAIERVRALVAESRSTGRRLSALDVHDAIEGSAS